MFGRSLYSPVFPAGKRQVRQQKAQEARAERDSVARTVYENELENVKSNIVNKDFTEAQLDRIIELLVENNKKLTQLTELWGMPKSEQDNYKPF